MPFNPVLQCGTFHQFHHNERLLVAVLPDFVHRTDVWMVQSCGGAGFPQESFEGRLITQGISRKKLQRHIAVKDCVARGVHNAHASAAKLFQNAIMRNVLADHE